MKKAGIIRKVTAFGLDIGMSAGAGFLLMWPLGTFEVQEAYEFNQIILRIIFLIVASFLIMNGWWLMEGRPTLGRRVMSIGTGTGGADRRLSWWMGTLRVILVVILSLTPMLVLFAGGIIIRILTRVVGG
jgi:hypothetical protein